MNLPPVKNILKAAGVLLVAFVVLSVVAPSSISRFISAQKRTSQTYLGSGSLPMAPSAAPSFENSLSEYFAFDEDMGRGAPGVAQTTAPNEGELTERKIVQDASLSLLVDDVAQRAADIKGIAERLGGFVSQSSIGGVHRSPIVVQELAAKITSGSVTIRVPSDQFDTAVDEVRVLAEEVTHESVTARDVTERFVDLEAQLRNLEAEEERYLSILETAKTVEDTLAVVKYLNNTRGQIERIEGQLKYLANQVDMSSVTVSLTAEEEVEVFGIKWRPLIVLKQAFRDGLTSLADYVDWLIATLFRLPALILWLVTWIAIAALGWRLFVWVRDRFFKREG